MDSALVFPIVELISVLLERFIEVAVRAITA